MTQVQIPDGYMQNTNGHLVPISTIKEADIERDELVLGLVKEAKKISDVLGEKRKDFMGEIEAFISLSAEKYDAKIGGEKGGVTLYSYDGKYKVVRSMQETLDFDERILAAKELIDECIHEWSDDSNDKVKALIEHAFQVDKAGNINKDRVLGLRKMNIKDNKWRNAMEALSDSLSVVSSKSYIRFYERDENGAYQIIPLDIAGGGVMTAPNTAQILAEAANQPTCLNDMKAHFKQVGNFMVRKMDLEGDGSVFDYIKAKRQVEEMDDEISLH